MIEINIKPYIYNCMSFSSFKSLGYQVAIQKLFNRKKTIKKNSFIDVGSNTFTTPNDVSEIEILLIAGGGGDGCATGGGGGAGGFV
jgi:hypothetical protein